ncbi:MAG: hypothetical protein ABIO93_03375 [Dyadobacter sp.]|uniref:hypothetical protein n=1 Tax=Dyadobacter sp. TaxID=1914288 RepID=UPI0032634FF4
MSHTVVKEKSKKTEAVVAYTEQSSSPKRVISSAWAKKDLSKMNMFDRKTAQMEETLKKFPLPSRK